MVSRWLSVRPSVCPYFRFRTITSKCQWISTKLGVCIDNVAIWFGIINGQTSSIFDRVICPRYVSFLFFFVCFFFSFPDDNFSKFQWIFTKLVMGIDIVEICFANGLISFIFGRVICLQYIHILIKDNNLSKSQWISTNFDMCIYSGMPSAALTRAKPATTAAGNVGLHACS